MLCWSIPQIMSHLTCDRVELGVCDWLENLSVQSKTSAMTQTSSGCEEKQQWMSFAKLVSFYCTSSGVCVSFFWNVLKVCSLSLLPVSTKQEKHMKIKLFHQVSLVMACVMLCLLSVTLHRVKVFEIQEKATSVLLFSAKTRVCICSWLQSIKFYICWTMMGFCAHVKCQIVASSNELTASWKHLQHLNCNVMSKCN